MISHLRERLTSDRAKSAGGAALLHALLGYALLTGLGFDIAAAPADTLKLFDVAASPPPPPQPDTQRAEARTPDPEGAAAPPNLEAVPTPIVAPEPRVKIEVPPLLAVAPIAGPGIAASAGAAERPGPGTGAGGEGNGLGSGRGGRGTGGGGGIAVRSKQIAGRIRDSDYPREASRARDEGKVDVRFTVGIDGRAHNCQVHQSSGSPALDATTCRLIEARFRFEPARNAAGEPVPELNGWEQVWWLERR